MRNGFEILVWAIFPQMHLWIHDKYSSIRLKQCEWQREILQDRSLRENYPKDNFLCDKTEKKRFIHVNPRTYMQINIPAVEQGGVDGPSPHPLVFLICCIISKRFYLQRKAFHLLYKMRYILWVVALLVGGGGGAVTSSTMVAILGAILNFTKN